MSDEWDVLSWKEKKAIRLSLKKRDGRIDQNFMETIYQTDVTMEKMRKLHTNGFLEKSGFGNKFDVVTDKIPDEVLEEIENVA